MTTIKTLPNKLIIILTVYTVFAVGILYVIWFEFAQKTIELEVRDNFEADALNATDAIQDRLASYENLLRNIGAFYESSNEVDRAEWAQFANLVNIQDNYPGASSITFLETLDSEELDGFVTSIRNDTSTNPAGYPDVAIKPNDEPRETHYVVKYIYPEDPSRVGAIGSDHAAIEERVSAISKALATNKLAATDRIIFANNSLAGFLLYYPVSTNNPSKDGISVLSFRAQDLFDSFFASRKVTEDINVQIFAGEEVDFSNILYEQSVTSDELETTKSVSFADKVWTIYFAAEGDYKVSSATKNESYIFLGFSVVALVAFGFGIVYLFTSREKLARRYEESRRKISIQTSIFDKVFNSSQSYLGIMKPNGVITDVNKKVAEFVGISRKKLIDTHFSGMGLIADKDMQKVQDALQTAAAGEDTKPQEITLQNAKSESFVASFTMTPIKDTSGELETILAEAKDVSEYINETRQLEKENSELEELNQKLVDREHKMIELKQEIARLKGED